MAKYQEFNRAELRMFPCSLEDLLPPDSVARTIWAALGQLDFGAIVSAQDLDKGGDGGQLQPQLELANEMMERVKEDAPPVQSVTADGAYHDTRQLHDLETDGVTCYVPEDRNASRQAPGVSSEYQADRFTYTGATDTMTCPEGQCLKRRKLNEGQTAAVYQAPAPKCNACPAKPKCCPNSKSGRCVNHTLPEYQQTLNSVADHVNSEEGKTKCHARWVVCEGAFARPVELLHWDRNRMWGPVGAEAELLWRQFTHNLMLLTGIWKPMTVKTQAG